MDITLSELESECDKLRNRLSSHEELQSEVLMLKEELETSLESHKKLQEVALAFEEENRSIQTKYTEQLKDKSKLDAVKIELEFEVESKKLSYDQLERKYNKMRDKIELIQEMEDQVYNLENEKRMNTEKIIELEESLNASYEDSDLRTKEQQDKIDKLAKENSEVNTKLVTYIEEVEDMDTKMEHLEKENEMLKLNLEKLKEMEMFGSHLERIDELEIEKKELLNKLEKEKQRREDIENELFRTEEELESYICQGEGYKSSKDINNNNNNINRHLTTISEINIDGLDDKANDVILQNQQTIEILNREKESLIEKVTSTEEELEVLLEENALLAKSNMELQNSKLKDQETFETQIKELQEKINDLEDERKLIEHDKFKRIVSSAEKEFEHSQKQKEENRENERLLNELKVAQEYLGMSNTRNAELQHEMERKEREYQGKLDLVKEELKTELKSLKVALEEGTISKLEEKGQAFEEERNKFLNQMEASMGKMKEEYENRIMEQNTTISNLEDEINSMRTFYEDKSISTASSTSTPPVVVSNGKCCSMVDIRSYRDASLDNGMTLRNGHTLGSDSTLANGYSYGDDQRDAGLNHGSSRTHGDGNSFRNVYSLRDNRQYESDMDSDNGDGLSEREMRRISYKVAEGSWKRLSCELPINEKNLHQIMNSNSNGQEKVYQLLHCWRTESNMIQRNDLLKELTEYIDPNRKDVVKFLREMSGIPTKDRNSIKTRFKKLRLTVRR